MSQSPHVEGDGRSTAQHRNDVRMGLVSATPPSDRPAPARRALVVDDEPSVAQVLRDILATLRVDADIAASGPDGLAMLAASPYDLVVTDFVMPGMSGIELARIVRRTHPEVQILIVTGSVVPSALVNIRAEGFLVLTKPFGVEAFKMAVDHALASSVSERA